MVMLVNFLISFVYPFFFLFFRFFFINFEDSNLILRKNASTLTLTAQTQNLVVNLN